MFFRLARDTEAKVVHYRHQGNWRWDWRREVRGGAEADQLTNLILLVSQVSMVNEPDVLSWVHEGDGDFTVASARLRLDDLRLPTLNVQTRWCSSLPIKVNVFIWRLMLDRLPTRFNLSKRGLDLQAISCPVCNRGVETIDHRFVLCSVSADIWRGIQSWCQLLLPLDKSIVEWMTWVDDNTQSIWWKEKVQVIISTTCWYMWRFRNGEVFGDSVIKKSDILDSIKFFSFSWLSVRNRKAKVNWNMWLSKPL